MSCFVQRREACIISVYPWIGKRLGMYKPNVNNGCLWMVVLEMIFIFLLESFLCIPIFLQWTDVTLIRKKSWKLVFFFKDLIYLFEREGEHKSRGREKQIFCWVGSQMQAWSQDPEIMTWAEDRCLTNWATQAPYHLIFFVCLFYRNFCILSNVSELQPVSELQLFRLRELRSLADFVFFKSSHFFLNLFQGSLGGAAVWRLRLA